MDEIKRTQTKIVDVMFLPNGNSAVFDEQGEQIPELQKPWFEMFVKFLEENNIDITGSTYLFPLDGGKKAKIIKTKNGYKLNFD